MNNQSPLVPQGSLLEQKNKGRAKVKIAVFFVLTVHGVALLALLMQGCQKEKETAKTDQSGAVTPSFEPTNTSPSEFAPVAMPATNVAPIAEPTSVPFAPGAGTEYVVVASDNFTKISNKVKVPVPAIMAANPGVEPTKLHVGQKLHIPPAPPIAASASSGGAAPAVTPVSTAGGEQLYTVKSGDNLSKIGGQFGVSVKAIRSANSLKTDSIRVGQKLKIPGKVSGTAANETAAAAAPAALPR